MKIIQYYAFNALGFFMFYLGFVNKHEWAMNVFLFMTWLSILIGTLCLSKTVRDAAIKANPKTPAPPEVENLLNLLIACCLAADARFITLGFFVLAMIGTATLYERRK